MVRDKRADHASPAVSAIGAAIRRRDQEEDADGQGEVEHQYELVDGDADGEEQRRRDEKAEQTACAANVRRAAARTLLRMTDGALRAHGRLFRQQARVRTA